MTQLLSLATRPAPTADPSKASKYRQVGIALAFVGLMGTMVAFIANLVAAGGIDEANSYQETLAWSFGLTILSFGTLKIGIAVILMGIVVRLWFRVDSVKDALLVLHGHNDAPPPAVGPVTTPYGKAQVTATPPKLLPIHRMARKMWAPMLMMGGMALVAGFLVSLVWANETPGTENFSQAGAWTQGLQFLGEGMLLSGIAFLLGTILAGLREGGGEVQASVGLPVTTLKMPVTAKLFVGFMMMGLMVSVLQFVLYIVAAGNADDPASFSAWSNWLGPFREVGLGLILIGIVLALYTIGNVLAFQFDRVKSIIRTGQ
jgi:hypothetical protein